MKKKKTKHYINNKDFYEALCVYFKQCEDAEKAGKLAPQIPNYIGEAFLLICNRLAQKPNFLGYSYKDEMISDGIENCVMQIRSFNPQKSNNPFAYFTTCVWNAYVRRIKKEQRQNQTKVDNGENIMLSDDVYWNLQTRNKMFDYVRHDPEDLRAPITKKKPVRKKRTKRASSEIDRFVEITVENEE